MVDAHKRKKKSGLHCGAILDDLLGLAGQPIKPHLMDSNKMSYPNLKNQEI